MLKHLLWWSLQCALIPVLCLMGFCNSLLYAQPIHEVAKLLASDGALDDRFGYSVDIDGDTVVVGAFQHDHQGEDSGAAYVFVRDGDTWIEQAELLPSDGVTGDQAGLNQIAVEGDTILLGALLHDDGVEDAGTVYVFERNGGTWVETGRLHANDRQPGDQFGITVDLDGNTAIVGANGDLHPDGTQGSVYVFVRNGNNWTQQAKLVGSEIDVPFPGFAAWGISIDGDTIAVGAPTTKEQGIESGVTYVYVRDGSTWTQQTRLLPPDGKTRDQFGGSTPLDHDTLAVSASRGHDSRTEPGSVYIYTRSGGIWTQQTKLFASDGFVGDVFGQTIAIEGNKLIIGSPQFPERGKGPGAVYIFQRDGAVWMEREKLLSSDGKLGDDFGLNLAMEGGTVVVGAPAQHPNDPTGKDTGSAYIFEMGTEFSNQCRSE